MEKYSHKFPHLDIENYEIEKECLGVLNKSDALRLGAIPLGIKDNIVTCCVGKPNMDTVIALESLTGKIIRACKDDVRIIKRKINENY